jgi:predicted acetyltransferase
MKLILPTIQYESSYRSYIKELADEERYPFPLDFDSGNFETMIERNSDFANGVNIPEGFVASSTFWMMADDEIIGVSNLRHELNDPIRYCGGHIGLGVRPSFRGKGYGIHLLALTVEKAKQIQIQKIHIHCHKNNHASVRMIKANGAQLDSELTDDSGAVIQRYIINSIA